MNKLSMKHVFALAACTAILASCAGGHGGDAINQRPSWLGAISTTTYDGVSDDLLTGGLGASGLGAALPPGFADPLRPTAAELRRNAIFVNYRAIVNIDPNVGYGRLYGPNVDAQGRPGSGEGKVAGTEYIAYSDDGSGRQNVTLMVQVPDSFDTRNPCIITGASSGSRGVYGAIGTSGEWGLKNRCAVAYTDKGTGIGLYTFDDDSVNLQNGVRAPRTVAGANAIFAPALSDAERAAFGAGFPGRIAFKHAHSQRNPEKDWGTFTLQSVEFALYVLNEQFGRPVPRGKVVKFIPANTIVIGSSVSNGGAAALKAAEQDTKGLIDGVAVSEPQIQPAVATGYIVLQGGIPVSAQAKMLVDYSTFGALYQPCVAGNALRCAALEAKGLLRGADSAAQRADALARLHGYGWLPDSDNLQAFHSPIAVLNTALYPNAYGRFSVIDRLCGFTFSATDANGVPIPLPAEQRAQSFAIFNGIPGNVVYEQSVGGARAWQFGVSPSTGVADQSLDGFLCLRALATGFDPVTGNALTGDMLARSLRVRTGAAEVLASARLHGKPALIVQGRSDALVPVNHASRAYLGLNATVEGIGSKLRYVEVMNANHFDIFATVLPTSIVPLHVYYIRGLDSMYAHLKTGAPLPQSQVVRTQPRGSGTELITEANVPPFVLVPAATDKIFVTPVAVAVPN